MKGIYLIAFLASVTAASVIITKESTFEKEDQCPVKDSCPPKLIVHDDCDKYYECQKGKKVVKHCKAGLHFSKEWQGCVKPDKAGCEDSDSGGSTSEGSTSEESGEDEKCTENGDLIKHECQCEKFYECKNKLKILHKCPTGEYFDKKKKYCRRGKNCKPITATECEDGDFIEHECQCTKYYECKNGQKALRECKKGSHFDKDSLECVKGTNCNEKDTCRNGEKKSHDCLCEKYYKCQKKEWIVMDCPEDEHFSPDLSKCTSKKKAGCEVPDEPGECPDDHPSKWEHECDCRLYYTCDEDENKKEVQVCPWGKYYDKNKKKCDNAEKVSSKCKNSWDDWL